MALADGSQIVQLSTRCCWLHHFVGYTISASTFIFYTPAPRWNMNEICQALRTDTDILDLELKPHNSTKLALIAVCVWLLYGRNLPEVTVAPGLSTEHHELVLFLNLSSTTLFEILLQNMAVSASKWHRMHKWSGEKESHFTKLKNIINIKEVYSIIPMNRGFGVMPSMSPFSGKMLLDWEITITTTTIWPEFVGLVSNGMTEWEL